MSLSVSPTEDDVFTVLRNFLISILPAGIEIFQGQDNRVSEPNTDNFVIMTPLRRMRLETNVDKFKDAAFIGSIAAKVMTITSVKIGVVSIGDVVQGVGVVAGTKVSSFGTGVGGIGTYNVSNSQTVSSTILQLGAGSYRQNSQMTIQIDVHGPDSADNAQVISTMFRDNYAYDYMTGQNPNVAPLFVDDPRQMIFTNEGDQIERRWTIDAEIQVNATVRAPQQFADTVKVGLINVDVTYPT